jgi:acyl carrier protein
MNDVVNKVQDVFRQVFDDESIVLRNDLNAGCVDGWTSLAHIDLIIAIERRLGIKFTTAEIGKTKEANENVGGLLAMINRKLSGGVT